MPSLARKLRDTRRSERDTNAKPPSMPLLSALTSSQYRLAAALLTSFSGRSGRAIFGMACDSGRGSFTSFRMMPIRCLLVNSSGNWKAESAYKLTLAGILPRHTATDRVFYLTFNRKVRTPNLSENALGLLAFVRNLSTQSSFCIVYPLLRGIVCPGHHRQSTTVRHENAPVGVACQLGWQDRESRQPSPRCPPNRLAGMNLWSGRAARTTSAG